MPARSSAPSNWPIACLNSGSSSSGGSSPRRVVAGSVAMRSVYAGLGLATRDLHVVGRLDSFGLGQADSNPARQSGIEERDEDPEQEPSSDHEREVVVGV